MRSEAIVEEFSIQLNPLKKYDLLNSYLYIVLYARNFLLYIEYGLNSPHQLILLYS